MRSNSFGIFSVLTIIGSLAVVACSDDGSDDNGSGQAGATNGGSKTNSGGRSSTGGATNKGGTTSGGKSGTAGGSTVGGATGVGGATNSGGNAGAGGASLGGRQNSGGTTAAAGTPNVGGTSNVAGGTNLGGAPNVGGATNTGGAITVGGTTSAGGTTSVGGAVAVGGSTNVGGTAGTAGTAGAAGAVPTQAFRLTIENISTDSALPTAFAPGAFALVDGSARPFATDMVASIGLEREAEDANPTQLLTELSSTAGVAQSGAFNMQGGGVAVAPIQPGGAFEITFNARRDQTLHFASMLGNSNDTYATTPAGIALFSSGGAPSPVSGDVTSEVALWDAGTERNEAPGMGPNQAPRQAAANTGPTESGVSLRSDGTRALPVPSALVNVSVALAGGAYSITLTNRSNQGPFVSPLSPLFYATHTATYRYMSPGAAASTGLERLAEDGNPSFLVTEANDAGATATSVGTAPYLPGATVTFNVTPSQSQPYLSFAAMIGQTNDAFIGTHPEGVRLLDSVNALRPAAAVQADIVKSLATWDAGTEANEVPGVGPNQAPRQSAANTGPADANNLVRLYSDSTNDLAQLSNLVQITITRASGLTFNVMVNNQSANSTFPLSLSPVAWALHDGQLASFALGSAASPGLERLAEDGETAPLLSEWATNIRVGSSNAAGTTTIAPGQSSSFQVTASATSRYLSIASMLVPSNDTFMALGTSGIALLDISGTPRSNVDIAADVAAALAAYEAGTEANQGGAAGPDMAPYQSATNTGANEGTGRVRAFNGAWPYPPIGQLLRVTLTPL